MPGQESGYLPALVDPDLSMISHRNYSISLKALMEMRLTLLSKCNEIIERT